MSTDRFTDFEWFDDGYPDLMDETEGEMSTEERSWYERVLTDPVAARDELNQAQRALFQKAAEDAARLIVRDVTWQTYGRRIWSQEQARAEAFDRFRRAWDHLGDEVERQVFAQLGVVPAPATVEQHVAILVGLGRITEDDAAYCLDPAHAMTVQRMRADYPLDN